MLLLLSDVVSDFETVKYKEIQGHLLMMFTLMGQMLQSALLIVCLVWGLLILAFQSKQDYSFSRNQWQVRLKCSDFISVPLSHDSYSYEKPVLAH